jgi:hypothetical protein
VLCLVAWCFYSILVLHFLDRDGACVVAGTHPSFYISAFNIFSLGQVNIIEIIAQVRLLYV